MKNQVKITEEELSKIINESVTRILQENMQEEGLLNNIKSAIKGAKNGFQSQKHLDANVDTDYTRNTRLSPNEMPSNDAAETVRNLYKMASEYHIKANQLRNKAKKIAEKYGVSVTDGEKKNGKLANKVVNYDLSNEYSGDLEKASDRHNNYVGNQQRIGNNFKIGIGNWE